MSQLRRAQERAHIDTLLQEAINQWRPDQPRRWLAKYGGWSFEAKSPLVQEYRRIRRQAKVMAKGRRG